MTPIEPGETTMHRRARLALAATWGLMGAGALVVPGAVAQPATVDAATARVAAADPPALSVRRVATSVELEKYGRRVYLDLGAFLVAGDQPVEARTVRPAYTQPLRSTIHVGDEAFAVPADLVPSFEGARLVRITLRTPAGKVVSTRTASLCSGGDGGSVRARPDAPDVSPYGHCYGYNPLALGSVHGLQAGWAMSLASGRGVELPLGRYVAEVSIRGVFRKMLGLPAGSSSTTIGVRVVRGEDECPGCAAGSSRAADTGDLAVSSRPDRTARTLTEAPEGAPLPDLRSLPAFGIQMHRGRWLAFGANVWNAGASPLVVDGFRREGEDVMDAYQYFYDAEGNPAGRVPTGTMEWDERDGHMHWHFLDFARYRLLDADKQAIVRSRKEAFCLANTDAIDYTLPEANWNPHNTDLHSACGGYGSIAVREVLDVGSGDTYAQFRPGQSFNVADLPAGKYFIEVTGNPTRNLAESNTTNNTAYRPVWITGKPGGPRNVRVRPVGLVDID
jgi:hypothetical protein